MCEIVCVGFPDKNILLGVPEGEKVSDNATQKQKDAGGGLATVQCCMVDIFLPGSM